MQPTCQDQGLASSSVDDVSCTSVQQSEVSFPLENNRDADLLEANSIKWNVARIVRLSSGRFALLTHYRAGALDIIKVGTIEEIVDYIPTPEQCVTEYKPPREVKGNASDLLADIGLV